ncbi:glycosyltransferase family 2 protein [Luteimonas marina]|uniref:Glycosyltransferase family 2 protein n=1 Tax=Luteimonas marina TaxID=488485 RepID=A0A5C5TWR3_9GAMM|nr:glycosyltransferase family 2 protein [Luteimonas marina]TWT18107.1 glycosyltransferase family 2 protein [Luteimonas marina]
MPQAAPWLSVLVPFHDVERYLEACVRSVLAQGEAGMEVVLLDDASTDGSAAIAEALRGDAPTVVRAIAHDRNRGISAARNSLLQAARGTYVWFVDSDDLLLPGSLRRLRDVVDAGSPDLVLCDFRYVRDDFGLKHRLRGERHAHTFDGPSLRVLHDRNVLVAGLLSKRQLHVWSKVAKREAWQRAAFPQGRYFEDVAVVPALLEGVRSWIHVPEPWVGYRQRAGSIMASQSPRKLLDLLRANRDLRAGLLALPGGLDERARFSLDYFCLRTFAWIARKSRASRDPELDAACRGELAAMFPRGVAGVLAACRRRGWLLRAWRLGDSLRRAGWR